MFSAYELSGQNGFWVRPVPAKPMPGYSSRAGGMGWPKKDPSLPHEGTLPMLVRRDMWLAFRVPDLLDEPFASITAIFQTAYGPRTLTAGPIRDPGPLCHEPLMAPRPPAALEPEPKPEPEPELESEHAAEAAQEPSKRRWLTTPEVLAFFRSDEESSKL